jgi:hypothetical protein
MKAIENEYSGILNMSRLKTLEKGVVYRVWTQISQRANLSAYGLAASRVCRMSPDIKLKTGKKIRVQVIPQVLECLDLKN